MFEPHDSWFLLVQMEQLLQIQIQNPEPRHYLDLGKVIILLLENRIVGVEIAILQKSSKMPGLSKQSL